MRAINAIYVHHSASSQKKTTPEMIDQWHKDRGWNGIGYHFVVTFDGTIHRGRDVAVVGAHCKGKNRRSIGICVTGNFNSDSVGTHQESSLSLLLAGLMATYSLEKEAVFGHREHGQTECPGNNLFEWLTNWRGDVQEDEEQNNI